MAVLLDTGPWVALLSRHDSHHRGAVEQFRQLKPPLLFAAAPEPSGAEFVAGG